MIMKVNMVGLFHGLKNASKWPKPYFINSFTVGVTGGEISSSLIRGIVFFNLN